MRAQRLSERWAALQGPWSSQVARCRSRFIIVPLRRHVRSLGVPFATSHCGSTSP
jgi:hypothetical protein